MKTMTCKKMGGPCDHEIIASTAEEMVAKGMEHLETAHPTMAADIQAMPKDHPLMKEWNEKFAKDWEATPETE